MLTDYECHSSREAAYYVQRIAARLTGLSTAISIDYAIYWVRSKTDSWTLLAWISTD
jgi:hypothetical protein